jgi:lipoprotein signal peptidase
MADFVTFALAFVAYVLLGVSVVLSLRGYVTRRYTLAAAVVATAHVTLVWTLRYGGSLGAALDKGRLGFVIFHSALLIIIAASLMPQPVSAAFTWIAFPLVTAGAVGAAFKYDYVAGYRIPLLVTAAAVVGLGILAWRRRRAERDAPIPP